MSGGCAHSICWAGAAGSAVCCCGVGAGVGGSRGSGPVEIGDGAEVCSNGWGGMGTPGTALCMECLSLLSLAACDLEKQLPGKQSFPSYLGSAGILKL